MTAGHPVGSVVVVGDVVLDRDVVGTSKRRSPDTGAPVLDVASVTQTPGGAGLTALLCQSPDTRVTLVAPIATDAPGRALATALRRRVRLVALGHEGGTRVKARLFAGDRAMLRLDTGGPGRPVPLTPDQIGDLRSMLAGADVVVVADYGAGTTHDPDIRALITEVVGRRRVVWDPHPRGGPVVPGVRVVTPNLVEARGFVAEARDDGSDASPERVGAVLRTSWAADAVCVTTGATGVTVVTATGSRRIAPPIVATGDPCGAGDRFAASIALQLLGGADVFAAAGTAVAESAAWVAGGGAQFRHSYGDDGPVDLGGPDLTAGLPARDPAPRDTRVAGPATVVTNGSGRTPDGVARVDWRAAEELAARVRTAGGTLVAAGGVFDVLHAGHVGYLAAARALGDALVVLVNSDDSVRRRKGPGRPVNPVADRAAVLAGLSGVDAVMVFDQDDPRAALAALRPDVWVKGDDYDPETMPETPLVRGCGGRVVTVPVLPGRSSTATLGRVAAPHGG